MNQEIINDNQPAKRKRAGGGRAFHSRLELFAEFIHQQRQQRKTWKEIAAALSGEKACPITAQGVHQFYRRYLYRRAKGHWEDGFQKVNTQPTCPDVAASRPQTRPAPLPLKSDFKQPDRTKCYTDQYT